MSEVALLSAFWLGLLTAISPCPLTTNITAISFISRNAEQKRSVLESGVLYSLGRAAAYLLLGIVITGGLIGRADASRFLQKHMNEALGPILILAGLVLLGAIGQGLSLNMGANRLQKRVSGGHPLWAAAMGFIFALSFCPVSAGLFFGALLPLALGQESTFMIPVSYSVGTSLPVILFAVILAFASGFLGKVFNKIIKLESWARMVTGWIFILAGIYYTLIHIYELSL
ncbi:MAG: sulfite exporter TauE/SafE family protein [Opitutales bacterium]|nr:sulfite exporter TauE/SafE family protein [Opitutales bacterium]